VPAFRSVNIAGQIVNGQPLKTVMVLATVEDIPPIMVTKSERRFIIVSI